MRSPNLHEQVDHFLILSIFLFSCWYGLWKVSLTWKENEVFLTTTITTIMLMCLSRTFCTFLLMYVACMSFMQLFYSFWSGSARVTLVFLSWQHEYSGFVWLFVTVGLHPQNFVEGSFFFNFRKRERERDWLVLHLSLHPLLILTCTLTRNWTQPTERPSCTPNSDRIQNLGMCPDQDLGRTQISANPPQAPKSCRFLLLTSLSLPSQPLCLSVSLPHFLS